MHTHVVMHYTPSRRGVMVTSAKNQLSKHPTIVHVGEEHAASNQQVSRLAQSELS